MGNSGEGPFATPPYHDENVYTRSGTAVETVGSNSIRMENKSFNQFVDIISIKDEDDSLAIK